MQALSSPVTARLDPMPRGVYWKTSKESQCLRIAATRAAESFAGLTFSLEPLERPSLPGSMPTIVPETNNLSHAEAVRSRVLYVLLYVRKYYR